MGKVSLVYNYEKKYFINIKIYIIGNPFKCTFIIYKNFRILLYTWIYKIECLRMM